MSEPPVPPSDDRPGPTGRPSPGAPPIGQPPYGPPPGQPPYGPPPGQPTYGPPPGQPPYGPPPGQPPYGQGPSSPGGPPIGQPPFGAGPGYQGPYAPQPPQSTPQGVVVDLGARARQRPEPRFGSSLAGVGAALVLAGALVWGAGYVGEGLDVDFGDTGVDVHGEGRRFLGAGFFLVLAVVGYVLLVTRRRGPLATTGAVLAAFSVPLLLGFATLSIGDTLGGGGDPVNLDAVVLGSIAVWLVTYVFVPGAKGRALFLAASAISLAGYVGFKVAGDGLTRDGFLVASGGSVGDTGGTTGVAVAALLFGLAYYVVAALLDRRGRPGVAVAFVMAGFGPTLAGIVAFGPDLHLAGTGVLLVVVGAVLAAYGGWAARRATTWLWSAAIAVGVFLVLADVFDGPGYVGPAVTLVVVGAVLAGLAALVGQRERPDLEETAAP